MYLIVTRENERLANQYENLYNYLEDHIREHDNKISSATETFTEYSNTVSNFSNSVIPSNHFDPKREELSEQLSKHIEEESEKRSELVNAQTIALERKEHYIALVDQEKAAEKAQRDKEMKELADNLKKKAEQLKKSVGL